MLETLGWGGFAHTVKARVHDSKLVSEWGTDTVAIKIPNNKEYERVLINELIIGNFVRETLREVSGSANVVRYLGFEMIGGGPVMVMEYVSGGSLLDLIGPPGAQQPLPVDQALELAKGILSGLAAIHQVGVFHRDIKPANILIDRDTPKIADLGISTMLHSKQARTTIGTLAYMSPEILGASGASFSSDIWSVGVTLYEMLTGSWPLGDPNTALHPMTTKILESAPEPPSVRLPSVPRWLDAVVLKALSKDPTERYLTPDEMRLALLARDELGERLAALRPLLMEDGDRNAAESTLRSLLEEFPDSARVYEHLGQLYNRSYRHGEAVEAFRQAIVLDRDDPALHWQLALAYQQEGNGRRATQSLKRAIGLGLDERLQRHAKHLLQALEEQAR